MQTAGPSWVRLTYTITRAGEKRDLDYKAPLCQTPQHLGGVRWWFICPVRGCGRRVRKLYLPLVGTGTIFACRHCHDLAYESSQEHDKGMDAYRHMGLNDLDRLMSAMQGADALRVLQVARMILQREERVLGDR